MKRLYLVVTLFAPSVVLPHEQPWSFVQAVGGLTVEAPRRTNGGIELPMHVDVSGLTTVTHRPTTINSGLICTATRVKVVAQTMHLTIETGPPRLGGSGVCPPAQLGVVPPGVYTVYYGTATNDSTLIGRVTIAP